MTRQIKYSSEPADHRQHTEQYDRFYSRIAPVYDWLVKILPLWGNWISATLPWIQGPKVLEVSFGTGYLLSQYADQFNTYGIDFNRRMARLTSDNLRRSDKKADLQVASIESLPYKTGALDTLVNTMAFSAYPDGNLAFSEMSRVLKPGGRLVMVDVNYPRDGNLLGMILANAWKAGGDIIRDMAVLFDKFGFEFSDEEIGGFGSVHLYVAVKPSEPMKC